MKREILKTRAKFIAWGAGLIILSVLFVKHIVLPQFQVRRATHLAAPKPEFTVDATYRPLDWQEALQTDRFPLIRLPETVQHEMVRLPPFKENRAYVAPEAFAPSTLLNRSKTSINLGEPMRVFSGALHAHTGWSDGKGDPVEAFAFARDVAEVDFFAVTDHPEFWLLDPEDKWKELARIAKLATTREFVALRGFEYSSPVFGHYVVLNSDGVCSAFRCTTLKEFYQWLALPSEASALAIFAHPMLLKDNTSQYEFEQFAFSRAAASHLIGIEVIHWDGYQGMLLGFSGFRPFIDEALNRNWFVGAVGSQDNHGRNWGRGGTNRIGILLTQLNETNILEALRARRFFATSSKSIQFAVNARTKRGWVPMGSILTADDFIGDDVELHSRFFDGDLDLVPRAIEWVFNGAVIASYDIAASKRSGQSWPGENLYYAGESVIRLPLKRLRHKKSNYLYVRFYQDSTKSTFTQSSPIFFR